MAGIEPAGVGQFRQVVRFERRALAADAYGNTLGDWVSLIDHRAAKLTPTRGGEAVIADRLQGESSWDLWVRYDLLTAQVTPDDRVVQLVNGATAQTFNILFAQDMTGRRHWLLMQLTLGKAVG